MRPIVLTNGKGLISRPDDDSKTRVDDVTGYNTPREKLTFVEAECFEPAGSVKLPRRPKETYKRPFRSQGDDMVSLFIGITIGVLSTTVSNQRELERLNELLEQAENLVRDLHNELERKDRLTVNHQMQGVYNLSTSSLDTVESSSKPYEATTSVSKKIDRPKGENYELTSDIEAELEAELERLEANLKTPPFEIDSDFELDMATGDLRLNAVNWQLDSLSNSDHDDKSQSIGGPVFTPNYVVSSLDLSLRLHEVIESGLRARIEELEAVLQSNQSKPYSPIEAQEENSFWDFEFNRMGSSSSTP